MAPPLDDALRDRMALHLIPGVGPRTTQALLDRFGSAGRALRASAAELLEVAHVGPRLAEAITGAAPGEAVAREIERVERHNVRLLFRGSPDYPQQLLGIPDAPEVLYVRGDLRAEDATAV